MRKKLFASILLITILLNIISVISVSFADAYTAYVFPLWENALGRLTSEIPFSVGEWMIIAGLLWIAVFLILAVSALISAVKNIKKRDKSDRRTLVKVFVSYARVTADILIVIFLVMTLNCFINYHTTPIGQSNRGEKAGQQDGDEREYTVSELADLRDYIVIRCNELAEQVERDEAGEVIYSGNMMKTAQTAMRGLSERFPKLSGYYVTPKPMFFSGFISQQYMQGYYFPFSMEANYNAEMYIMNKPFTMCHELAHTKSYIMEDEANFLAYLACVNSDDMVFNYSGYLGILNYVNNEFNNNVSKDEYKSHVEISDTVKRDNIFLTKESWDRVEETAVFETEKVRKAADTFVDTTLKVNGIDDGIASYSRVVELILMDYYD